ncbi:MAG: hypothetical protein ACKVWV_18505 [Planctomycetota bacterium]
MHPALLEFAGLAWERPLGFLALALPIALLLGARRTDDPLRIATAWLALWRAERASRAPALARPRRSALSIWLFALALACGALALAGPRPRGAAPTWHCVLDRSPSMYFAPLSADARASTRIEDAITRARAWLAEHGRGGRTIWIAAAGDAEQRAEGSEPPREWLAPPRAPLAEPAWSRYDEVHTLWITDRVPDAARSNAGLVASGAAIVPGAILQRADVRTIWDGARVVEEPAPRARVVITGEVPPLLARALAIWAEERGLALERMQPALDPDALLVLRSTSTGEARRVEAGRDGWRASGEARGVVRRADDAGPLASWLAADGRDLVTFGPGRIESAWSTMGDPNGDPAAFAVSWGMLFDAACLPAAGVVSFAERAQASSAVVEPPRDPPAYLHGDEAWPSFLATWLTLAALALVVASLAVRGRAASVEIPREAP